MAKYKKEEILHIEQDVKVKVIKDTNGPEIEVLIGNTEITIYEEDLCPAPELPDYGAVSQSHN